MICLKNRRNLGVLVLALSALAFAFSVARPLPVLAQATISTGSIQGTITDPSGAVVPGAKVTITNKATGLEIRVPASSAGVYNSGPLLPGEYVVSVQVEGFKTTKLTVLVQVGTVASGDVKLQVGAASTVVEVAGASPIQVNTVQATVQDVLTQRQIEDLPVNGRNFLDLATLEPGVQIQDGATFDPTKNGYSSVSFGGRYGRTARIEVDGVDISDETVGTTTQNIPQSAIQEFQVSQSSLDLSTELTSSGTINVTTRSGTNSFHGGGFFYGRSDQLSAKIAPVQPDFARKQYGADLGGPFIKDKVFFFGTWERTQQDLSIPVSPTAPFTSLAGTYNSPFRDSQFLGRLDYKLKPNASLFYRFSYEQNTNVRPFGSVPASWQPFQNTDHTPVHIAGLDFTQGRFTHSLRFGYTKFHNQIVDGVAQAGALNLARGIELSATPVASDTLCLSGFENFCSGTNILAPQVTFQRNLQGKYDGTFTFSAHTLRYGFAMNAIKGGGFASFIALAPAVSVLTTAGPVTGAAFTCPGGATGANCPLNYAVNTVLVSNGQGFGTLLPSFGFPAGGQFDTRLEWYVGDTWKARHNLTISYGLRYVRDTGRSDNQYAPIPCSPNTIGISCTGNLLDQLGPGLGNRVNQPNNNYAPTLGIAWDPTGSGKTVIRVGGGLYYENAIFNNVLFDPSKRLQSGLFLANIPVCSGGTPVPLTFPNGTTPPITFCGQPVGAVASNIAAYQQSFEAATTAAGPASNGIYFGNNGCAGLCDGAALLAPSYRTPFSWQMNIGIQHQFGANNLLTVDYVRNIGLHYLVGVDVNHVGDARFLNRPNAMAAMAATFAGFCNTGRAMFDAMGNFVGCPGVGGSRCSTFAAGAQIGCTLSGGATILDYAGRGLDGGIDFCGGAACPSAAFPGKNRLLGVTEFLFPIGRSVYNGLLVSWKSNLSHPLPGMHRMSLLATYALSRFNSLALDQDFLPSASDMNNPLKFFGPNSLDRTHQVGIGATIDLPAATRVSLLSHWATAPPLNLLLPTVGTADIFTSNVTGDGTTGGLGTAGLGGEPLPGTNVGSYGRSIKSGDLASVIQNYNNTGAGKLTPAGQALISAGLFTAAQLQQLGAVTPTLPAPVRGHVGPVATFGSDLSVTWILRPSKLWSNVPETVSIEPQVSIFNVFNYQNFSNFGISGVLTASAGNLLGTTRQNRTDLVTPGTASGVNWYNVPRQLQFGVKINF